MKSSDPIPKSQEIAWVLRAQQGDADAFGRLVEAYDRRLLYFVLRFLPDGHRALDILQEVWLTLFRRLSSLRAPEAFRVWLYQIAHDKVVDLIRRQSREERAHEILRASRNGEYEEDHEELFDRAELVHHALQLVSVDHREVLVLRFLEDMSLEEIATTIRCSSGTVKSRLHYAKQALRREVEKLVHEET